MVGFETTIDHLDGHKVKISRNEVTIPGQVLTIKGEGMPLRDYPEERGNLKVTIIITFPAHLSDEQKEGFRKLLKK